MTRERERVEGRLSGLEDKNAPRSASSENGDEAALQSTSAGSPDKVDSESVSPESREVAVRASGLAYRYREDLPLALDGIDLDVQAGESFGLVGPDGAGKTTLMRIICGLHQATAGEIRVFGSKLPEAVEETKPRLGYVSQRFSLYGDLTIKENLDFFADIHGVRGKKARERKEFLLEFSRLSSFRSRLADRLSGGMRQKLSLICTLVHEPELLLLDEPTTGVDPITRRDFWSILTSLSQQGLTVIMSTPYLDEAERCSRVALIDKGKVLACGQPDALRSGSGLEVLEVVCQPVRKAAELLAHLQVVDTVHSFGDRLHVLLTASSDSRGATAKIREALEGGSVQLRAIRSVIPGLEDVFINLVESHERQAASCEMSPTPMSERSSAGPRENPRAESEGGRPHEAPGAQENPAEEKEAGS